MDENSTVLDRALQFLELSPIYRPPSCDEKKEEEEDPRPGLDVLIVAQEEQTLAPSTELTKPTLALSRVIRAQETGQRVKAPVDKRAQLEACHVSDLETRIPSKARTDGQSRTSSREDLTPIRDILAWDGTAYSNGDEAAHREAQEKARDGEWRLERPTRNLLKNVDICIETANLAADQGERGKTTQAGARGDQEVSEGQRL